MLVPSPPYLSAGDTAWQLTAATFVGLQSIPGLAVLYGGLVKKKWAVNSVMMALYAFSVVLITWSLWGYNMGFGTPWKLGSGILSSLVGIPKPALGGTFQESQAVIPLLASGMPAIHFPMAALVFFQFVFAAITPIILAGGVLGRMNFKAWMLFVPLWSTFVYCINAFLLWGGGWLAQLGAVDYSGGYVIHVAAGVSGFVAAAVVGPRLMEDRENFVPNNLLMAMVGAGILWLGWNGFNGGDPYFANADAAVAVFNTDLATATALVAWLLTDYLSTGKASLVGAVNGMIAGLVAITPAAGYVNGYGALAIGVAAGLIPWFTMNVLGKTRLLSRVDDTLGVLHTHAIAGAVGGLLTGLLADPRVLVYAATGKTAPVSVTGMFYGNPHQFVVQLEALLVIAAYDAVATFLLLKLVSLVVPLREPGTSLETGDREIHGETAYAEESHGPLSFPREPAYQLDRAVNDQA